MPTIVEYTDTKAPLNQYPRRIISPLRSSPCCFSESEGIGPAESSDRWVYRYRRCRVCGFTVRLVLREIPDAALLASVQKILSTAFQRNNPDY